MFLLPGVAARLSLATRSDGPPAPGRSRSRDPEVNSTRACTHTSAKHKEKQAMPTGRVKFLWYNSEVKRAEKIAVFLLPGKPRQTALYAWP